MPSFIDRETAQRVVTELGGQLAEVLPDEEYEYAHIAGAVHLPLKQLTRELAADRLDVGRPVIAYCASGQ